MSTKKELWLPVGKVISDSGEEFDFTNNLLASNRGRIFVLPCRRGRIKKYMSGYIVEGREAGGQHMQIGLTDNNNKHAFFYVHRLIAFAWLDKKPHQNVVMHIDDNPTNNNIENLRWGTQKENLQDAANKRKGGPKKKYSNDLLWEIFNRREKGESLKAINKMYSFVPKSTIQHMTSGKMLRDRKLL